MTDEIAQPQRRDKSRHDFGDEDHGVAQQLARIEFDEGVFQSGGEKRRIEQRRCLGFAGHDGFRESVAGERQEMFDDWAERERGKKLQAANDHDDADEKADEQGFVSRECAGRMRNLDFRRQRSAIAITGTT